MVETQPNLNAIPNVLTIAGSDSGGGAGIQADLKAFSALGAYGASVITALTAQNTRGVTAIHTPDAAFVSAQLDAVFDDIRIDAVKIGMLANAQIVRAVADALRRHRPAHVVLDTVMISKSNHALLAPDAVAALRDELLPLATLVTPNLPEAAALLNEPGAADEDAMVRQGEALLALGARGADERRPPGFRRQPRLARRSGRRAQARRRAGATAEHARHGLHAVIGDCGADPAARKPRERSRRRQALPHRRHREQRAASCRPRRRAGASLLQMVVTANARARAGQSSGTTKPRDCSIQPSSSWRA